MIEKKGETKVNLASWAESWPNNPSVPEESNQVVQTRLYLQDFFAFLDTLQLKANNLIDTTPNSDPFDPMRSQLRAQTFPLTLGLYKPL